MSDRPADAPIYSIDTNSLMDWQYRFYPGEIFPGLIASMESLAKAGRLLAPALVREEIESVGTAGLRDWCKGQAGIFVPTGALLAEAHSIQGQFPGLLDPKAEHEEADAYVIALARTRNGVVVTQETAAAEKRNPKRSHFIPDVCRDLGIPCINLLGLMRREGWTF
jgi:hypothetical protein